MVKHAVLLLMILAVSGLPAELNRTAVFELVNLTPNPEFNVLSETFAKSLRVSLLAGKVFDVIDPEVVGRALDSRPTPGEGVSFDNALIAADRLGAGIAVIGSYAIVGETIQIGLEAVETLTRRVKVSASVEGSITGTGIFDLADEICGRMADRMAREMPAVTNRPAGRKRALNVEDIYRASSRRNSWFYAMDGVCAMFASFDTAGTVLRGRNLFEFFEIGYGYKRFRLRAFLPSYMYPWLAESLVKNGPEFASGSIYSEFLLEYSVIRGKLVASVGSGDIVLDRISPTNLNIMMKTLEFGARYRPVSPLWVAIRLGYSYQTRVMINGDPFTSVGLPPGFRLTAEGEWIFKSGFGVRLFWTWCTVSSKEAVYPDLNIGKIRVSSHFFLIGPCYNAEF